MCDSSSHKTRAGNEPSAWPTGPAIPRRQEMKRRSLIDPLTLHPHSTQTPPSTMPQPVSRRTGRKVRPYSLAVGGNLGLFERNSARRCQSRSIVPTRRYVLLEIELEIRKFREQTFLFHALVYPYDTEWTRFTVLAYSCPINGGKVAHNLLYYAFLCHGVLLFCYQCIKSWLLVNTEEVVGEFPFPLVS